MIKGLQEIFGTWYDPLNRKGVLDLLIPILKELQALSKRGKKIFPSSSQTFRAFQECKYEDLVAICVGLSPYHTMTKEKIIIADGVALSCGNTNKEQPSLTKWYDAVQKEFPNDVIERRCDLSYLCNQGILMYNFGLTVENQKAACHNDMWEPFTKAFITEIIGPSGIPVIILGREVKKVEKWLYPFQYCFKVDHPASAAYSETDWDSEGVFRKTSQIIKANNNIDITWWPKQDSLTLEQEFPADLLF